MGNLVAGSKTPGSGWSQALNSGGYLTQAYHFYPKGETRSSCQMSLRKSRVPVPEGQLPAGARKCKACVAWATGHPDGGVRYTRAGGTSRG